LTGKRRGLAEPDRECLVRLRLREDKGFGGRRRDGLLDDQGIGCSAVKILTRNKAPPELG